MSPRSDRAFTSAPTATRASTIAGTGFAAAARCRGVCPDRPLPGLPKRYRKKWSPVGLNERLRLYRYDVGQQFDWHMDGYYERDNGDRSFFTFMVYLNDGFEGGEAAS